MCYAGSSEILGRPRYMDITKAENLLHQAADLGCTELHPFFTADPLCYPDLWKLLDTANSLGMKIVFYTNAQDLDQASCDRLLAYRKVALTISLDAYTEAIYKKVRPGLNFDTVCRNARYALRTARQQGQRTRINYVVLDHINFYEMEPFQALWGPRTDELTFVPNDSRGRLAGQDHSDDGMCASLWTGLSVLSDGTATMCCQDYKPLMPLGNVFDASLEAVWNGALLQWVRELHQTGRKREIAVCRQCKTRY